jgi:hypothetical protein
MKIPQNYKKNLTKRTSKHKYLWQEKAEEVSNYFGQPLYWIFWKHSDWKIMQAYEICKEKGEKSLAYFLGVIKKK